MKLNSIGGAVSPIPFAVVTTCHAAGWQNYGRRMVETFDQFWPAEIPLYLYAEGFEPEYARPIVRQLPDWLAEHAALKGVGVAS